MSAGVPIDEPKITKKKFKKKQPNPLSCKRKKKVKVVPSNSKIDKIQSHPIQKKSRSKLKIPKHVKEHLRNLALPMQQ